MKEILSNNNHDLLREIQLLRSIIHGKVTPSEIILFKDWLLEFLTGTEKTVNNNLYYLSLGNERLYEDVLKKTQIATMNLRLIGSRFVTVVYRHKENDLLCLRILQWLHGIHPQTSNVPFGISDGSFSIYPYVGLPTLYFLPNASQLGLLHLPLFFHEYGHYLYAYHKKEMDDLADGMQIELDEILTSSFQQNDTKYTKDRKDASIIIETWLTWIQEVFCDAIGLSIGGESYLYAFSHYLRMSGKMAMYRPIEDLAYSTHPVSWIRIKLLVARAHNLGLHDSAQAVERDWSALGKTMRENGNFHGYYLESYRPIIERTVNDMLVEANPINFADYLGPKSDEKGNFINMLNEAWKIFLDEPKEKYYAWEDQIIKEQIQSAI